MGHTDAYVLTSTGVAEREADARDLASRLESLGLFSRVELVPAILWNDDSSIAGFLSQYPEHHFEKGFLEQALQGQVCCTLSHISLWRRLLNSDSDAAMVFEDDIYISDVALFRKLFRAINRSQPIDWVRIHLHKEFRKEIVAKYWPLALVEDPSLWGFAAYWVSRRGAAKLVGAFANSCEPVDNFVVKLCREDAIKGRTANKVVVEHHAFTGDAKELLDRPSIEQEENKVQKQPSTIYSSPPVTPDTSLHHFLSGLDNLRQLRRDGVTVLKGVFDEQTIRSARAQVLAHVDLFSNTRPTPSSRHLAGFHEHPELVSLHTLLSCNEQLRYFVMLAFGGRPSSSIGLTDITINRSQHWHTDLLRGRYEVHLKGVEVWHQNVEGVLKLLLYLQDGDSLRCIRGSHLVPVSLNSDAFAQPGEDADVISVPVTAGDVVVMDIRACHRGSGEEVFMGGAFDADPKILISTAIGVDHGVLTAAMETGNAQRLIHWRAKHRD